MNNSEATAALQERRDTLLLRLQQNRRYLSHQIDENENKFPRSFAMRMMINKKSSALSAISYLPLLGRGMFKTVITRVVIAGLLKRFSAKRHLHSIEHPSAENFPVDNPRI